MISNKQAVWDLAVETMSAFTPFYQEIAVGKIRELGASDSWFALVQAAAVAPLPLTMQRLVAVSPYTAPSARQGLLSNAVAGGQLAEKDAGAYELTDEGRGVLAAFYDTAHELISTAPTLSEVEMDALNARLGRLVFGSADLPVPELKPALAASRWTDPGPDAPANVTFDQYVTDLLAFRDDAHAASWQNLGVDGRTWETLTLIWRGDAAGAADLHEELPRRGWSTADYAVSLDLLAERGWLQLVDGEWQATEAGAEVRQAAENETERLFFAAWDALDQEDLQEMETSLHILLSRIKEAAPQVAPA
jgi:Helix-turn-helix family